MVRSIKKRNSKNKTRLRRFRGGYYQTGYVYPIWEIEEMREDKIAEEQAKIIGIREIKFPHGEYTGNHFKEVEYGDGVMEYNNGDVYKGHWKRGYSDGMGEMEYNNGDVYIGLWKRGQRSGNYSTFIRPKVFESIGNWINDIMYEGTINYKDGRVYTGSWNFKNESGKGIMKYPNGIEETGVWKNNKREKNNTTIRRRFSNLGIKGRELYEKIRESSSVRPSDVMEGN